MSNTAVVAENKKCEHSLEHKNKEWGKCSNE